MLSQFAAGLVTPEPEITLPETDSTPKEVLRELKESYYGTKNITDFADFLNAGTPSVTKEPLCFETRVGFLRYATSVLKYVSSGSKLAPSVVKLTVFENELKLTGYTAVACLDVMIPLVKASSLGSLPETSFLMDFNVLSRITANFDNETLKFQHNPKTQLLSLDAKDTHLETSTREDSEWVSYHARFKSIQAIPCRLNGDILTASLRYLSLFARKDIGQESLAVFECRDGSIVGGHSAAVGVFKSDSLRDTPIRLKHEIVPTLQKVLPFFCFEKMALFETETFYIIRDQNLYLAVEKTPLTFPALKSLLSSPRADTFRLPRQVLLGSLQKLSVVLPSRDVLLKISLVGSLSKSLLVVSVRDQAGKESRDILPIERSSPGVCEDHSYYVDYDTFQRVVSFGKTTDVTIHELKTGILLVDTYPEWETSTVLTVSKQI